MSNLYNTLKKVNPKEVSNDLFDNLRVQALVANVHDTDTITVLFVYPGMNKITKTNLRLLGIDAPELHSKVTVERELCLKGKAFLDELILDKIIDVEFKGMDKYGGRYLADIFINKKKVNDLLIDKKFVRKYDGGKKTEWVL